MISAGVANSIDLDGGRMTRRARKDWWVNRLIDMVVEEVSLIDRGCQQSTVSHRQKG